MNQKETIIREIKAKELLDFTKMQHAKQNKAGFAGSFAHARRIFEVCWLLNAKGYKFYTEAYFKNGGRADIFILNPQVAIEIMESESQESIEAKKTNYPCKVIALKTTDTFYISMVEE